jgi:small subunit ribosomal protein S21
VQVLVRDNNVDQAMRVLKKKLQREGVFREMKLRRAYEKPSERKVREKSEAVRRMRKLARKKAQREGLIPMPKKKLLPAKPPRRFRSAGSGRRPRPLQAGVLLRRSKLRPTIGGEHRVAHRRREALRRVVVPPAAGVVQFHEVCASPLGQVAPLVSRQNHGPPIGRLRHGAVAGSPCGQQPVIRACANAQATMPRRAAGQRDLRIATKRGRRDERDASAVHARRFCVP